MYGRMNTAQVGLVANENNGLLCARGVVVFFKRVQVRECRCVVVTVVKNVRFVVTEIQCSSGQPPQKETPHVRVGAIGVRFDLAQTFQD